MMILPSSPPPKFQPGELVEHARYGYRGVVVAVDPRCMAADAWYFSNRTQPEREQPWYHVLVDGGRSVTYTAQTSLVADSQGGEISHPLLAKFFDVFQGGHYLRNSHGWAGW